jgi:hypothetical protein
MDKDVKITPGQLAKAMDADYQKLVQQLSVAVNEAPDGAVISGSEELVRETMADLLESTKCYRCISARK